MAVTIAVESPLQDDVRELIAALNAHLLELTPPEFCSHLTVEQMADADTTVFIARDEGVPSPAARSAATAHGIGEVKRMYTLPARIGAGTSAATSSALIEARAREDGLTQLVLETGPPPRRGLARLRARRLHALRPGARLPGYSATRSSTRSARG